MSSPKLASEEKDIFTLCDIDVCLQRKYCFVLLSVCDRQRHGHVETLKPHQFNTAGPQKQLPITLTILHEPIIRKGKQC